MTIIMVIMVALIVGLVLIGFSLENLFIGLQEKILSKGSVAVTWVLGSALLVSGVVGLVVLL